MYKIPDNIFPIGYKYVSRNKRKDVCEVVDHLTTFNAAGEIVLFRYVARHLFCGQLMTDYDVCHTTLQLATPVKD